MKAHVHAGENWEQQHFAVVRAGRDLWGDTQPTAGLTAPIAKGTYGSYGPTPSIKKPTSRQQKHPHKYKIPQLKNLGCCKRSAQTSTQLCVQRNNYIWKLISFKMTLIYCSATSSFPPPNRLLPPMIERYHSTYIHGSDCRAPKRCLCICSSWKQCRHIHMYTEFARDSHSYCTGVYTNKYSMAVPITVAYLARVIPKAKRKVHFRLGLFFFKNITRTK